MLRLVFSVICALLPMRAMALETSAGDVVITPVVQGLDAPWSLGFLPGGGLLITERAGRLLHVSQSGAVTDVAGLPEVAAVGQGGLLDLLVPRDFASKGEVFLSYAQPDGDGAGTAIMRATLSPDRAKLTDVRRIFTMTAPSEAGQHFGSRLVEAKDGTLFLTIGDRGERPLAQDLTRHNGKVLRLSRDGAPAAGNPDLGDGALPEIWSYGHRNPQGAALDLAGNLWVNEHGARGGDEVNRIRPGVNYGWPVIAYGRHYSGAKIGEGTEKSGMAQPEHYWDPSIAPSGMVFYSGALWPEWRGDIFVGSLKFDYISRLDGAPLAEREQIQSDATQRVRDIREGPDGAIWFLSVGRGAVMRMAPAQ
ncbi:PQQ-dependent sugar dehydrogenase [Marinovum sp. 2_MG-2023]|uniref:PQQ-dependent sugar dehydrogenase n=1 Tax=unclassified Marinovum TaxID=2647166 RepID=UPI0026E218AD|nr:MULTISPECIES: PQQ-dependent sugar dehydrogenase [unclassified Marinovum]MDO6732238.1 PQQ-dependent sugar dehydrogenase [Marinovum sp. 2_MG-2023]MDO6781542.1 PQQ-dependent sugar dehydrogenase [Marinovum sp. 1_MG-2023]